MRNLELDSKRMKSKKKRRENDVEVEVKNEEKSHERNPGDGKKKRRRETKNNGELVTVSEANSLVEAETVKKMKKKKKQRKEIVAKIAPVEESDQVDDGSARQSGKSMKSKKDKKKNKMKPVVASEGVGMQRKTEKQEEDVYCLSSGDEDCSKGMKKWLTEYNESRPGLRALQQRIDDFIISHEEKLEEEKKEREAQAADGGWTVVVHQRGRKKTTDPESGIAVGSAVPVAKVDDITTKKKRNEIGVDFYRFQKREAHMNEILQLQSKFEEDKKRIQQLRAARKFRPY
ncbi:unnamed protein product [Linum tenue]|uniref:Ribosomal RNA-processing protein 7 C-terminal domain-containing protein n=1 Tax=Linum tenue TaxID=586396 RepID=A0AAV0N4C0_9ROSI|nr:unnamed protein product [Linum tenue]